MEQEFTALYERLRAPIYGFAAARLSAHSAFDVVNETFSVAWAKWSEAPADEAQRAAWCFGIARNKILQEIQRTQRKHHDNRFIEDLKQPVEPHTDDVADAVIESETGRLVWHSLSEDDRELALVVASNELSGADMAAMLDISHVAFRRRLSRLRERIETARREVGGASSEGGGAA